jgi:Flp pilus assembly protein TadG
MPRATPHPIRRLLARFRDDARGAIVVLAAILFPVLIGGLGLWVETGYWYHMQRKVQHAADTAAFTAVVRLRAGDALSARDAAARRVALASGWIDGAASDDFTVYPVTVSGSLDAGTLTVTRQSAVTSATNGLGVTLRETHPRWFTSLFLGGRATLAASAVAQIKAGTSAACMLALSKTAPGAITVGGSTAVTLNGCDMATNSASATAFSMGNSGSSLTTGCISAVGGAVTGPGLTLTSPSCPEVVTGAAEARDPYAAVAEPALHGPCETSRVGKNGETTRVVPSNLHPSGVKSIRFCKGLDLNGAVELEPGLYIIEGGSLTVNGGAVGQTIPTSIKTVANALGQKGVTFLIAPTADVRLNGTVTMDLAAPTTGPYSGLLFFGSRSGTTSSFKINGGSDQTLQGAIYAPASLVDYVGNATTDGRNGCTQIVADRISFSGNSTLSANCALSGTSSLYSFEPVGLVM